MPNVKCSVQNCYYYGKGNVCNADSIMVETEQQGLNNFNEEFGQIGENNSSSQANGKEQTICATFRTK